MVLDFDDHSRFSRDRPIVVDGQVTIGRWRRPSWLVRRPPANQIGTYSVTNRTEGRPDLISNEIYGTPSLDWVLIAFNQTTETLNWPRAGDAIEYPLENVVYPEL